MSNRSLLEFNHDFASNIERDREAFVAALVGYLSSASPRYEQELSRYGVHSHGVRHHSDDYEIKWGGLHIQSYPPPKE